MEVQRWTREHVAVGLWGRVRAYGQVDGPGPVAGLLVGLILALGGWVVPHLVDLVRSPASSPTAPAVSPVAPLAPSPTVMATPAPTETDASTTR